MIEVCGWCHKAHETGGDLIGGIPFKTCPDIPEDTFVPMNKVPVVIHGPQGEVFESYRYVVAGMPTSVTGDVDVNGR